MKYVSPKYEMVPIDVCDVIMSDEPSYIIEETSDENGNTVGNVIVSADSIFAQYFN